MTELVENRKYIRNPEPIKNPKRLVKGIFINLIRELFSAEKGSSFEFTNDPKAKGLKVWPRYPRLNDDLPLVTVTITNWQFSALTINRFLPASVSKRIDSELSDKSEPGNRQAYRFNALLSLDVTAVNDDQRDELIDKLIDFIIWDNNTADLNVDDYLKARGIHLVKDTFGMAGDQEIPLPSNDISYGDGFAIPIVGTILSPKAYAEPLEGVEWQAEVVESR